jgi:hypothetical protein
MRFALLLLVSISACNSEVLGPTDSPPTSLHAQLSDAPTRLVLTPGSSGSVVAQRWSSDGWQQGLVELSITDGEIVATVDASGQLVVTGFSVGFATIDIPSTVIGTDTQLTNVRLTLQNDAPAPSASWTDPNDTSAMTTVNVGLSWSLLTQGSSTPLGTQDLHGLPMQLALSGNGQTATGTIEVDAMGDVWSWADLVKLSDLSLALDAATPPPL